MTPHGPNGYVVSSGGRATTNTCHTMVAGLLFLHEPKTTDSGRAIFCGFFAAIPGVTFEGDDLDAVRDAAIVWLREQVDMVESDFLQPSPGDRVRLDSLRDVDRPYFVLHRGAGATVAIAPTIVALLAFAAVRAYVVLSNVLPTREQGQ